MFKYKLKFKLLSFRLFFRFELYSFIFDENQLLIFVVQFQALFFVVKLTVLLFIFELQALLFDVEL